MNFVEIAKFRNRFIAETIAHALDQYSIPYQVLADDGGGNWGVMLGSSARLEVPEDRVEETRLILDSIVHFLPFTEDEQFGAA